MRRRVDLLHEEGIEFVTNTHVGKDVDVQDLRANWCVVSPVIFSHFQGPRSFSSPLVFRLRALSGLFSLSLPRPLTLLVFPLCFVWFCCVVLESDALVLTIGSTMPRDLRIPNREANGIHFAMEFLTKNQKRLMMTTEGTCHIFIISFLSEC